MRGVAAFLAVPVSVAFGGCYLPSAFRADLRITLAGDYKFQYEGLPVHVPLLENLSQAEMSAQDTVRGVAAMQQDLQRDTGFEEVTYLDRAAFRVPYRRVGNIRRERSFNFVRAGARILSIERCGDGAIHIQAENPNTTLASRLEKDGIAMRGRFRIQTEAAVSSHNAEQIIEAGAPVYVWNVEGFGEPSPSLVFAAQP